jgi:hypothetical protein
MAAGGRPRACPPARCHDGPAEPSVKVAVRALHEPVRDEKG